MKSVLLWYNMYSTMLKNIGFVFNPYDPCNANCLFDGKQCMIAWYIDDNKISQIDPRVVSMIIDHLEEHFGKMTVTR